MPLKDKGGYKMSNDPIKLLNQFSIEAVARCCDTLELAGCNEKISQAVRKGIYSLRDSFVLKLKGEAGYDYRNK